VNSPLANLNLLWMPDDHTSGVGSGDPNPVAQVADNDLAVGRIVDAFSNHPDFTPTTSSPTGSGLLRAWPG
jgi:hypothetical protein